MSGYGYGAILSALGGVLQSVAAEQAGERMRQAFIDELARQQHLGQQSYETWQGALPGMGAETAQQQIAQGAQRREKLYSDLQDVPLAPGGDRTTARDTAQAKSMGQARGQLGGYSDWELMQHINSIRTQNELNKISNFSQGWERVFPYRLDDAQHSQDELAFFGNLVSSVGGGSASFGSLYGGGDTQRPSSTQFYSPNQPGVQGGYDYNVPSNVDSSGNPYSPYSIFG